MFINPPIAPPPVPVAPDIWDLSIISTTNSTIASAPVRSPTLLRQAKRREEKEESYALMICFPAALTTSCCPPPLVVCPPELEKSFMASAMAIPINLDCMSPPPEDCCC